MSDKPEICDDPEFGTLCLIDGVAINVGSLADAVTTFDRLLDKGKSFFICTLNLDHLVKLRRDIAFKAVYDRATMVCLDSTPLVWLAALRSNVKKAAGADLLVPICRVAMKKKVGVFLVGPSKTVNDQFGARAEALFGAFASFHDHAPSTNFDPFGTEADSIIECINRSDARVCLIALGAPKSEIFADRIVANSDGVACAPIGAAIEFFVGQKRRAPLWMQRAGFEWLWRLLSEPRRLWRRYLACLKILLRVAGSEVFGSRSKRADRG